MAPTASENTENLIISVKMIKREMALKECCSAADAVAGEAAVTASMITRYLHNTVNILVDAVIDWDGLISTLADARRQT